MNNKKSTILAIIVLIIVFGIAGKMDEQDENIKYGWTHDSQP